MAYQRLIRFGLSQVRDCKPILGATMIKATVYSAETRELSGIGKTSGKPYRMAIQTVYLHLFDRQGRLEPVPTKLELTLEEDRQTNMPKVYQPGEYELHPSSFYMGKFGLEVAPKLVPLTKTKAA